MVASHNKNTTTHTQTLSSLIHFPSHIRSQSQSSLYNHQTTRLRLPVLCLPASNRSVVVLLLQGGFSHSGEIKMLVLIFKNILLLLLGKHRHMWRRQRNVIGHVVRVLLKSKKKIVTLPGKTRTNSIQSEFVCICYSRQCPPCHVEGWTGEILFLLLLCLLVNKDIVRHELISFITETTNVYCAVRTECLHIIQVKVKP